MKKLIPAHLALRLLLTFSFGGVLAASLLHADLFESPQRMISATFLLLLYRPGPVNLVPSFAFLAGMLVIVALMWKHPGACAAILAISIVLYHGLIMRVPDLAFLCTRTPLEALRDHSTSVHVCICLAICCLFLPFDGVSPVYYALFPILTAEDAALFVRMWTGRCLVLKRNIENEIREKQQTPSQPGFKPNVDSNMAALYERIQKMMETKKPFIEESFDQTQMSRMMCTNTTYISKTINACYGQNFSRYVNSFRVRYAIDIIKADRRIKLIEVAAMSGFHTQVSFDMAFRTYTGKTPTEYFRDLDV